MYVLVGLVNSRLKDFVRNLLKSCEYNLGVEYLNKHETEFQKIQERKA